MDGLLVDKHRPGTIHVGSDGKILRPATKATWSTHDQGSEQNRITTSLDLAKRQDILPGRVAGFVCAARACQDGREEPTPYAPASPLAWPAIDRDTTTP